MCGPTSESQSRVIAPEPPGPSSGDVATMNLMPEPFLSAEIDYRQQRAAELYSQHPSRRRHWVPRRPTLHLPAARRRPVATADPVTRPVSARRHHPPGRCRVTHRDPRSRDDGRRGTAPRRPRRQRRHGRSRHPGPRLRARAAQRTCPASGSGVTAPRSVLLVGDAGVGKTRLLTELRDRACAPAGGGPGRALPGLRRQRAALPAVLRDAGPARHRRARARRGARRGQPALAPAAARSPDRMPGADPATSTGTSTAASSSTPCTRASRPLAGSGPLLLVVEDVHWADQSTRDLLGFLFARPFASPVAIVASYRSDDLHRRHPLRARRRRVVRLPGVDRLQLGPLPDVDVRALVRAAAPGAAARARGRRDRRPRRGQRVLRRGAGRRAGTTGDRRLPDDLADLLLVRLDRLAEPRAQVVRAASVRGPAGHATGCSPPVAGLRRRPRRGAAGGGRAERAGARRRRRLRVPARAARPRRSTTTCCRASGSGCTRPYVEALRRRRRAAPPPSSPATPGRARPRRPRCAPASGPATRRWRSAAPTRRPHTSRRRSSCCGTRRPDPTGVDLGRPGHRAADALIGLRPPGAGRSRWSLLAEHVAARARRLARRAAGPAAAATALASAMLDETTPRPARADRPRRSAARADEPPRCGPACCACTPGARSATTATRRPRSSARGAGAGRAARTCRGSPPSRHHPGRPRRALRRLGDGRAGAGGGRSSSARPPATRRPRCAAATCSARSHQDRARWRTALELFAARLRAGRARRAAVGAVRLRGAAALGDDRLPARRLGRGAAARRRRGQAPPAVPEAMLLAVRLRSWRSGAATTASIALLAELRAAVARRRAGRRQRRRPPAIELLGAARRRRRDVARARRGRRCVTAIWSRRFQARVRLSALAARPRSPTLRAPRPARPSGPARSSAPPS